MQNKMRLRLVGSARVTVTGTISISAALVIALAGCRAGFPVTSPQDRTGPGGIYPHATFDKVTTAAEIRHELTYTDAGKALQRSLHVHGGWDRWRSLTHVEYTRTRVVESDREDAAPGVPVGAKGVAQSETSSVAPCVERMQFDLSGWSLGADGEEWFFSLPFVLVFPKYTRRYLGVEWDIRLEVEYEKVELVSAKSTEKDPDMVVAYFDSRSGLVRQVLRQRSDGSWLVVRFFGWETVAGMRLPTRREFYVLKRRFRRLAEAKLKWKDTLSDFTLR